MNTENAKEELISWISQLEDESLIENLQAVKKSQSQAGSDWWTSLPETVKDSIERAEADIAAGRTVPHEKVRKSYQKWL